MNLISLFSTVQGPTSDHTNPSSGYFIYTDSKDFHHRIQSLLIDPSVDRCLEFYYHMFGVSIGSLNVYLKTNGTLGAPIFSRMKNQGDTWLRGQVKITKSSQPYMIVFETVVYESKGVRVRNK